MLSDARSLLAAPAGQGRLSIRRKTLTVWGPAAVIAGFSLVPEAHGYIDPGAGSILLQGIIGGIAASLALGAAYWSKVRAFFSRRRAGSEPDRRE